MNSPSTKYKNLKNNNKCSPIEIKEKMRKSYKNKVQNCRDMLMNRLRGVIKEDKEVDIRNTLNEIYKNVLEFADSLPIDEEEIILFEQIQRELVQEEFEWCLAEYEKSQNDIDWSSIDEEDKVICPVCQRHNLTVTNNTVSCSYCKFSIVTHKSLDGIKNSILTSIERHSSICDKESVFTLVPEINETHIYLICSYCSEMQIIL